MALGAVIRGETDHYEHIAREAAAGLAAVSRETGVPVGFGVLTVRREAQAWRVRAPGARTRARGRSRPRSSRCDALRPLGRAPAEELAWAGAARPASAPSRSCTSGRSPVSRWARVLEGFWRVAPARRRRRRWPSGWRSARRRERRARRAIQEAATHWRLDRIAPVDRTILRLGAYELDCERGTPAAVVLDEAVELAKRFGEADSPAFVNGVLDAIRKRVRGEPETTP